MKTYKQLLNESSLSRIYQQTQDHDTAIITAFRDAEDCGKGREIPNAENRKRNAELLSTLKSKGYGVTSVQGKWVENIGTKEEKEVGESSFFVVDLKNTGQLQKDVVKLGKKYEQDAVIFIEKGGKNVLLIGTNECGYPGLGKIDKLGTARFGRDGKIKTKVRGRPFIFGEG